MLRPDILLVSLGSTAGLRAADDELRGAMERAGAHVVTAQTLAPRDGIRTLALVDAAWARAARATTAAAISAHDPRAIVYSTTTAALLWPRPGAIRFDALSAANRPGRHGVWQRPLERHRLRAASLLLPWAEGSLAGCAPDHARAVVVPVPVAPSGRFVASAERDIAAIAYGAHPEKKGIDRVVRAFARIRRDDEELVIAGVSPSALAAAIGPLPDGVRAVGVLPREEYRALLRRTRVYVTAPRREDYGIAQLEALADGCRLVTTVAPGPYAALPLARALDPRFVAGGDGPLPTALRAALDDPGGDEYAARAAAALAVWQPGTVDAVVATQVLPALLR